MGRPKRKSTPQPEKTLEDLEHDQEAAAVRREEALRRRTRAAHKDVEHVGEVRRGREEEEAQRGKARRKAIDNDLAKHSTKREAQIAEKVRTAAADFNYAKSVHYEQKFRKLLLDKNLVSAVEARREFAKVKRPNQVIREEREVSKEHVAKKNAADVIELRKKIREMRGRRLSLVGQSLVLIDSHETQSIPNGFIEIDGRVEATDLCRLLEDRVLERFPRMCMLVEDGYWKPDLNFDIHRNVFEVDDVVFHPGDEEVDDPHSLINIVNHLMNTPIDWHRPPWEIYLLHEKGGNERSLIFWRLHHAIGDGTSFGLVVHALTDQGYQSWFAEKTKDARRSFMAKAWKSFLAFLWLAFIYIRVTLSILFTGFRVLWKWYKLSASSEPVNPLKGKHIIGPEKRTAFFHLDLKRMKALSKRAHATLNDVFLTLIAGGVRRCYEAESRHDKETTSLEEPWLGIPVNVRFAKPDKLGNEFGFVTLPLPVFDSDIQRRLRKVKGSMNQIKSTPESLMGYLTSKPTRFMSESLVRKVFAHCTSKLTLVASNVFFPFRDLTIEGVPCTRMWAAVNTPPHVTTGCQIFTYGDTVTVSVALDTHLDLKPTQFLKYVSEDLAELESVLKE